MARIDWNEGVPKSSPRKTGDLRSPVVGSGDRGVPGHGKPLPLDQAGTPAAMTPCPDVIYPLKPCQPPT